MLKIRISFPYPNWPLSKQLPQEKLIWNKIEYFINPPNGVEMDFDFWFVFNYPLLEFEQCNCKKGGLILITGEPSTVDKYSELYLKQFDHVITSQEFLKHTNKHFMPQGLPWFIDKSYDELAGGQTIPKTRLISVIASTKDRSEGHKKRLEFVSKIKEYFKDGIDWFGRGVNEFHNKWDVLAPYKYSIAIENYSTKYYFTEKLTDCYLAETFPIYSGCTNVEDYFTSESFLKIDLGDFEGSVRTIENLLNNPNHFETSLPLLRQQKIKVLNQFNLFSIIDSFVNSDHISVGRFIKYKVYNINSFPVIQRLIQRVRSLNA